MADEQFHIVFTERAWDDLTEIVEYWTARAESDRGEKYAHDLPSEAIRTLSNRPGRGQGGIFSRRPIQNYKS